jgi:hypothetical protein
MAASSHADSHLNERLDFLGFDAKQKASLRSLKPLIERAIGPVFDHVASTLSRPS